MAKMIAELPGLQGEVLAEIAEKNGFGVSIDIRAEGRFIIEGSGAEAQVLFREARPLSISLSRCSLNNYDEKSAEEWLQ